MSPWLLDNYYWTLVLLPQIRVTQTKQLNKKMISRFNVNLEALINHMTLKKFPNTIRQVIMQE